MADLYVQCMIEKKGQTWYWQKRAIISPFITGIKTNEIYK